MGNAQDNFDSVLVEREIVLPYIVAVVVNDTLYVLEENGKLEGLPPEEREALGLFVEGLNPFVAELFLPDYQALVTAMREELNSRCGAPVPAGDASTEREPIRYLAPLSEFLLVRGALARLLRGDVAPLSACDRVAIDRTLSSISAALSPADLGLIERARDLLRTQYGFS